MKLIAKTKNLILIIFIVIVVVALTRYISQSEDFAAHTIDNYDVSYTIENNIYKISDIENETMPIAEKYDKNLVLHCAKYTFDNGEAKYIDLTYGHRVDEMEYVDSYVVITVDAKTGTAVHVLRELGVTKLIAGENQYGHHFTNDEYKKIYVRRIYDDLINFSDYKSNEPEIISIDILIFSDIVEIICYANDNIVLGDYIYNGGAFDII